MCQRAALMPGAELKASVRDGVVTVLRGDLDVTGAADAQGGLGGAGADPDDRHLRARLHGLRLTARPAGGADASPARRRRCGPGRAAAARAAAPGPDRRRRGVLRSGQRRGCRRGYRQPQDAIPLAAACGACCTSWEGSLIAYVYRVSAAGAAAALAGSLRGPMRR